mmetsp:Transcript_61090/g.132425  ORF Transcript_61090/g.132425 Transcript_61090/m.132425 type:complete len:181 (-) Transcript_61090:148-690(-)|eukprot:CAMPEP_0170619616 /NCGR_PEP_ID=MMETSP0224-20130122/27611_1 /TAXON_ID=285029 /ORGANISM="Togula jolla, Strain CCCM 725" /LENGTH=180 /DNA_ID=CAMNT_0010945717 /DNA_START=113 /DNA_END=655 /DNA_ORIENTATION=+
MSPRVIALACALSAAYAHCAPLTLWGSLLDQDLSFGLSLVQTGASALEKPTITAEILAKDDPCQPPGSEEDPACHVNFIQVKGLHKDTQAGIKTEEMGRVVQASLPMGDFYHFEDSAGKKMRINTSPYKTEGMVSFKVCNDRSCSSIKGKKNGDSFKAGKSVVKVLSTRPDFVDVEISQK